MRGAEERDDGDLTGRSRGRSAGVALIWDFTRECVALVQLRSLGRRLVRRLGAAGNAPWILDRGRGYGHATERMQKDATAAIKRVLGA
jgi:hypothetical protein